MSVVDRLSRRVAMVLGLGRQTADTDESATAQRAQLTFPAGELRDGMLVFQCYGVASRPLAGADHLVAFLNGDRRRGISIGSNDQRCRPSNLAPGEVCVFDHTGSRITLHADGSIALVPSNGKVSIAGSVIATGDVIANGISLEQHVHGGVQPGNGVTGAPQG